jgi:hypothetical protein
LIELYWRVPRETIFFTLGEFCRDVYPGEAKYLEIYNKSDDDDNRQTNTFISFLKTYSFPVLIFIVNSLTNIRSIGESTMEGTGSL